MTEGLLPLQLTGLWLAGAAAASLLCAWAYPLIGQLIAPWAPGARSLARLVYVLSPPLSAGLVVLVVTQPAMAALLIPEHCHAGVCGGHTPVYAAGSGIVIALAAGLSLAAVTVVVVLLGALRTAVLKLHTLRAVANGAVNSDQPYQVLQTDAVVACCVGLWRPQVLLSQALLQLLQPEQLRVVLAHEQAHAARLDNLRGLLVRWATLIWPGGRALQVRKELSIDAEQACDAYAAQMVQDPSLVVQTIRQLAGQRAAISGRGMSFGMHDADARIAALQVQRPGAAGAHGNAWLWGGLWFAVCWSAQVVLLTAGFHAAIELLAAAA